MKTKRKINHTSINVQSAEPVFIHSLWRAGSTYLFSVFRRSASGYWCYQEPVHEVVLYAKDDPDSLLLFAGEKMNHLRHPEITLPYYYELIEMHEYWHEYISKSIIYDGYFEERCSVDLKNYLGALFENSKGRPVVQECRTSCRIKALRDTFNGVHLYLWRNPWDQWWSFKVTDYFDMVCQLIINAPVHPEVVSRLREEIDFNEFHNDDISQELANFDRKRLSSEDSYLVFYLIWCMGLLEGIANATFLVNIDTLSDSKQYQQEFKDSLLSSGVSGLDFSDCSVYQYHFTVKETTFFTKIEDRVHGLMLASGYSQQQIDGLLAQRRTHEPVLRLTPLAEIYPIALLTDAERAREIVIRYETAYSARLQQSLKLLENESKQLQIVREELFRLEQDAASREIILTQKISQSDQELNTLQHSLVTQEKEFRSNLFATQKSSEIEKAELQRLYFEREQSLRQESATQENALRGEIVNLIQTLARREQEFGERLDATHQSFGSEKAELQRMYGEHEQSIRHEYADRENSLRNELDNLHNTLDRREQEFCEKLFATQQSAENEKTELLRLYVEQEKTLQQQHKQFRQIAATFEEHLKQQLQAEQQAGIQLKQALEVLQLEMDGILSSFSWWITAPLRKVSGWFNPSKILSHSESTKVAVSPAKQNNTVELSAQSNETTENQFLLESIAMPNSTRSPKVFVARNLDELFSCYDEQFVRCSYRTLLSRDPDPEGLNYYLTRVRKGISKIEILAQIRQSAEGKAHQTDVAGLQEAINSYQLSKLPVIGPLVKLLGGKFREPNIQQRLRIIENQVFSLTEKSERLNSIENQISTLNEGNNKRFDQIHLALATLHSMIVNQNKKESILPNSTQGLSSNLSVDSPAAVASIMSQPIIINSEQADDVISELAVHVRRSSEALQLASR